MSHEQKGFFQLKHFWYKINETSNKDTFFIDRALKGTHNVFKT